MNFFGYFSKHKINPSKASILYKDDILDYSSLFEKIQAAEIYLHRTGVERNDKIGILADHSAEFVITIFALWKLNAVPVPLNKKLLNREIENQVEFAGCKFLIYDPAFNISYKKIKSVKIEIGKFKNIFPKKTEDYLLEVDLEQTALVLFTSGSTGNSKAVIISFNNLIRSAEIGNQVFQHRDDDIWLAALPFFHVGGFSIIVRTFLYGAILAIPEDINRDGLKRSLEKFDPSLSAFVTTQLKRLLDENIKPNPRLRHILLGGGFIDSELVRSAYHKGWNVSKSFGATETSSFVTALTKNDFELKSESAGKALTPNKILIVDENRNILPENISGEVVIESDAVARGYLNNSEKTEEKFSNNKFFTGDYGYMDKDGYLYIEARRNDLIVSGGENISPYEVEKILLEHPDILDAAVFGLEDKEWGHSLAAALIIKGHKQLALSDLRTFLKDKLPSYKHPKKIFILERFPKTPLGKIRKEEIKKIIGESCQSL